MYRGTILLLVCLSISGASSQFFSFDKLRGYAKYLNFPGLTANETGNELWSGLIKDCKKKVTFSCIQRNAYAYLDDVLVERDNVTVFDGLVLTKNNLDYGSCARDDLAENSVDGSGRDCDEETEDEQPKQTRTGRILENDAASPLQEITRALRRRTAKFLATRDYQIQLPEFFFEGATVKLSPREVDESGALVRIDFGQRALEAEGRLGFKKIRKFFQEKLLMAFLALLLIIKLIKVKFMFVIPFLFGVGTAKKLFLKLLLFFIPAFAHIFKLCSSFYSTRTKYHHHHHQVAHHHHHVPVPVPVPTYYDHHHPHGDDFNGYDYTHPHIQYRKDMDELKEWGIEPFEDPYDDFGNIPAPVPPASSSPYAGSYGLHQYAPNARPIGPVYQEKQPPTAGAHAHNLAYSAYVPDNKYNRRVLQQQPQHQPTPGPLPAAVSYSMPVAVNTMNLLPGTVAKSALTSSKVPYVGLVPQNVQPAAQIPQQLAAARVGGTVARQTVPDANQDDSYYGPIIARLEEIFAHLRFVDESCRERLVCSMYKNPSLYSPHSNLVSNELSRDPQELKQGSTKSSLRFHKYQNAARLGQDGGDCIRTYPCHINTE